MIDFIRCTISTVDNKLAMEQTDLSLVSYDGKPIDCDGKVITLSVQCNGSLIPNFTHHVCENGISTMGIDLFDAIGCYIATSPVQSVSYKSMAAVTLENYTQILRSSGLIKRYQHKLLLVSNSN